MLIASWSLVWLLLHGSVINLLAIVWLHLLVGNHADPGAAGQIPLQGVHTIQSLLLNLLLLQHLLLMDCQMLLLEL